MDKRSYPSDDERVSLVVDISRLFKRTFVFVDALVRFLYLILNPFVTQVADENVQHAG